MLPELPDDARAVPKSPNIEKLEVEHETVFELAPTLQPDNADQDEPLYLYIWRLDSVILDMSSSEYVTIRVIAESKEVRVLVALIYAFKS